MALIPEIFLKTGILISDKGIEFTNKNLTSEEKLFLINYIITNCKIIIKVNHEKRKRT